MLVRVAIDCDALIADDGQRTAVDQQRLARALAEHGVLVRTKENHLERLLYPNGKHGRKLDVNMLQVWQAFIGRLRWLEGTSAITCLCETDNPETFRKNWADQADVAVVGGSRGQLLGLPMGENVRKDEVSGIELTNLWSFDETEKFIRARDLSKRTIWKGADREAIWKDRFDLLARTSLHITIVDRYAGLNLVESERRGQMSGLEWLLRRLCDYPKKYVALMMALTDGVILPNQVAGNDEVLEAVRRVVARLPKRGVEDVKVTLLPKQRFGRITHDRRVRFENIVVGLDKGLAVFESSTVASSCECPGLDYDDARKYENDLRSVAGRLGFPRDLRLRSAT